MASIGLPKNFRTGIKLSIMLPENEKIRLMNNDDRVVRIYKVNKDATRNRIVK